ncbi:MAG TPA: SMP-30/gluconolactonase/LRE family protein [Dehalococcoidia bacterium]|jgi:gluconolactonase|nr:SMP-30/gluconolactonase/LRE family protein [Dehalococcoidia bacterium]HIK88178.1 SMP-30/gluconolactonase/LRE family protein [Dehalococcoidia bacterium]
MVWKWTQIANHDKLTEGPVWDGSGLLYNECSTHTTFRWDPKTGESSVWRENTGAANGQTFDRQGQLFACEGDAHRVTKIDTSEPNANPVIISDSFKGDGLNWPNDLAVDSQGRVYFTDPNYSQDPNNLEHESVYMTEHTFGGNWNTIRVTFDTRKPNGVLFSIDQKTLFVADTPNEPEDPKRLLAYPVNDDGTLGDHQVLHDFGTGRSIDGMTLTSAGTILATAGSSSGGPGPMIYEFETSGRVVLTHPSPADNPTNCTFGGSSLSTLFVTFAGGEVYQVDDTGHTGHLAYPQRRF